MKPHVPPARRRPVSIGAVLDGTGGPVRRVCVACGVGVWCDRFVAGERDVFRCTACKGGVRAAEAAR